MKILLTGATGFFGRHVVTAALARGWEINALVRKLPALADRSGGGTRLRLMRGSLAQAPDEAFRDVDVVVHLAAYGVSPQPCHWAEALQTNVLESAFFLRTCIERRVRRLLVCGSCHEYGVAGDRFPLIPADAPLAPIGAYATSKAAASVMFAGLVREKGWEGVLLRPFNLYGEGAAEESLWGKLVQAAQRGENLAMTEGAQVRDFLDVKIAAEQFLDQLGRPVVPGQVRVQNIGSGIPVTVRDFATAWWKRLGATGTLQFGVIPTRTGEIMRFVPDLAPIDLP